MVVVMPGRSFLPFDNALETDFCRDDSAIALCATGGRGSMDQYNYYRASELERGRQLDCPGHNPKWQWGSCLDN